MNTTKKIYPIQEISQALETSINLLHDLNLDEPFDSTVREELETTVLGLIKSLRISAFRSSEK